MGKYKRKISSAVVFFVLFILLPGLAEAKEPLPSEKEVVFVLDASGSMRTNDPKRLAIDGIAQFVYTLPSNYAVGVVSYNTDVILERAPVEDAEREALIAQAEEIVYADYSNAGAGLSRAVEMLNSSAAEDKTIVLVSDGEILMGSGAATEQAENDYQSAIEAAQQNNITIHVVGLGSEMENQDNSIFTAANRTGGGVYYTPQAIGIQSAIDDILKAQMGIKQTTAAMVDTDGTVETLSLDMPFSNASKVRILLVGNTAIENLNTNFQAESAKQINGERYSLIEMAYPKSGKVEVSFSGKSGSRVYITMIPEYQIKPRAEITYTDIPPEEEGALYYDREASIICRFYDLGNENLQLWTEEYFNHSRLSAWVGGTIRESAIEQGQLLVKEKVKERMSADLVFDYSVFPVNVIGGQLLHVELEEPPPLPEEEPKPPYLLIGLGIAAVLALGVAVWLCRRPKPEPPPQDEKPEPGKYSYVGKLNIYITRTPSGYDVPPLSYDLFRLPAGKVISLGEVLESCDIKEHFAGAEHIYFKSDAGRSIILTNNSDCTILRSREILMKKKSYQIPAGTKMDVAFEDEISELTVQYKDLKPSEMW